MAAESLGAVVQPDDGVRHPRSDTVAAGTRYTEDFTAATMAETNGRWTSGSGLGRFRFESATGVEWAGGAFRLQVAIEDEDTGTRNRKARIYSSTDGASWRPDRGDWVRHENAASAVESVCELPDGTPFAVGSSQSEPNAESEATTWTHRDGRWNIDVPRLGGEGASVHSCATTDDVTVVSGSVDGDGTEWTTKDGKTFTAGDHLPRGRYRGVPVEVDGGLVAPGWLDTAEHAGPVVWFTRNGKAWQWAALDMAETSSSVQVRAAGDESTRSSRRPAATGSGRSTRSPRGRSPATRAEGSRGRPIVVTVG